MSACVWVSLARDLVSLSPSFSVCWQVIMATALGPESTAPAGKVRVNKQRVVVSINHTFIHAIS